jgi:hypothetical protein
LDDFLGHEGVRAVGASEARTATIAAGADLPYGFAFTLSHTLSRTTRFQQVSEVFLETETKQEEWPAGNVRWNRTFRGGPLARMGLGTSFRHREGSSRQVSRGDALSAIESSSISPDLQLGLRNGMSFSFGLNTLKQRNASNGNETRLNQRDLTGSFDYAFRLPQWLSRGRKQVRSSTNFLATTTRSCLQQTDQVECTVVSDVGRRQIRGGLDTDFLQTLSGGLQLNYSINDAKHLSRRTSQISIIASFNLSLFAGDYR